MNKNIYLLIIKKLLLIFFVVILSSCKPSNNVQMRNQTDEIKSILDSAMLSEHPMQKFTEVLPRIKEYSSVDSAWIADLGFYVKYKKGGTVSWLLNPMDLK